MITSVRTPPAPPAATPVKLTTTPADAMSPVPTQDGARIIFADGVDQMPNLSRDLYVVDQDGKNQTKLTNRPELSWEAAVSPDNTRLAYVVEKDGHADIHIMNLDGTNDTNLTKTNGGYWEPQWSPDGKTIVATTIETPNHNEELVSIDVVSGKRTQLTDTEINNSSAAHFTPDGSRIVFSSDRHEGVPQLYSMKTDGSDVKNHAPNLMMMDGGSVSKDGHVVFSGATPAGDIGIYTVSLNDGNAPKALEHSGFALSPSYSPDNSHVAYLSYDANKVMQIVECDADGSNLHAVTTDKGFHIYPTYMPDGNHLTYVSDQDGKDEVYRVDLDPARQLAERGPRKAT